MIGASGFLMVRLGERRLGLPIGNVIAVESVGTIHPVPANDPACRGVTSSRGRLMPVLSLRTLVEGAGGDELTAVILQMGGRYCCLLVDDAEAIVDGDLLPVPPGEYLAWASSVVRRPEGLVPLLDLAALNERLSIPEEILDGG
ncbi:MAG: chemotaxis protein CheW [Gemmatimonadota bacterium]